MSNTCVQTTLSVLGLDSLFTYPELRCVSFTNGVLQQLLMSIVITRNGLSESPGLNVCYVVHNRPESTTKRRVGAK